MFQTSKNFEEHQQLFHHMSPQQLCLYCEQHPTYSLPAGILNYRTKKALAVIQNNALWLSEYLRLELANYIKDTLMHGPIVLTSDKMNSIFDSLLRKGASVSMPLKTAIADFVGFARAPLTREKQELLNQFVARITPSQKQKKSLQRTSSTVEHSRRFSALFSHHK